MLINHTKKIRQMKQRKALNSEQQLKIMIFLKEIKVSCNQ